MGPPRDCTSSPVVNHKPVVVGELRERIRTRMERVLGSHLL
jgi:hypothetical protein